MSINPDGQTIIDETFTDQILVSSSNFREFLHTMMTVFYYSQMKEYIYLTTNMRQEDFSVK